MLGGEIVVPPRSEAPDSRDRTGLLLKNQTGTIHVEGLRISGADLAEGINLDQSEGATVVLENIHVDTVHGSRSGHHADVLQTWAGPATLRVDGLTGSTEYQGLFLLPQQFVDSPPSTFDLRRVVITGEPDGANGGAAYLLWTDDNTPWLTARDIVLVDRRTDLEGMVRPLSAWQSGVELTTTAGRRVAARRARRARRTCRPATRRARHDHSARLLRRRSPPADVDAAPAPADR